MAITEAQIRSTVEEFLNLEIDMKDFHKAREEALTRARKKYEHQLEIHKPKNNSYDVHAAAPIISAYDDVHHWEEIEHENLAKFNVLAQKIRYFITALNGNALYVHFEFDDLDHRAGDHIFYIENNELKSKHYPAPRADENLY